MDAMLKQGRSDRALRPGAAPGFRNFPREIAVARKVTGAESFRDLNNSG